MTITSERAAAALELLPEEMREPAVQYLLEQAEKFRILKELVSEGKILHTAEFLNGIFRIFCAGRDYNNRNDCVPA